MKTYSGVQIQSAHSHYASRYDGLSLSLPHDMSRALYRLKGAKGAFRPPHESSTLREPETKGWRTYPAVVILPQAATTTRQHPAPTSHRACGNYRRRLPAHRKASTLALRSTASASQWHLAGLHQHSSLTSCMLRIASGPSCRTTASLFLEIISSRTLAYFQEISTGI